ncbi:MAG: hypothetical protein AAB468_01135 [Patescibacteria group bacterium]
MDNHDNTSFIPKQVLATGPSRRHEPRSLFMILSTLVFVVSFLFAGGVYAFRSYLTSEIKRPCETSLDSTTINCGLEAKLERQRQELDQQLIADIQSFYDRLQGAKSVIGGHLTLLPVFDLLEAQTLKTISYDNFNYREGQVVLSGKAAGYESIALQSDELGAEAGREISKFVFSDLVLGDNGRVGFKLTLDLAPELVSYQRYLDNSTP